ncbi:MAG: hypothetical protein P8L44_09465 [Opitutales bacterium]|jgi:hypothetical protein|nr:hypothetical protein [Opitutales bacterium]
MKLGQYRTLIGLLFLLFCSLGQSGAQTSIEQFEVTEFQVTLADNGANPFDRHPLATCQGPNGAEFSVTAYFT